MSGAATIQLERVSKRYETGTHALQGIDLDINEGEFVSLVGPSGCGKSTLLRIMAGLGHATEGTVSVLGREPHLSLQTNGQLGFVFQEANLMPWRSVLGNVELPLEMRGNDKKTRRVEAERALEMVGLSSSKHLYPRQLSGGMKMRVSIARALVSQPKILFMDEPFGALDEMTRHHLHQELLEIWLKSRITIVFVTHNVFEAVFLSNKVVVMQSYPGSVHSIVDVAAPYPRDDEFQSSGDFGEWVHQVTTAMKGAKR